MRFLFKRSMPLLWKSKNKIQCNEGEQLLFLFIIDINLLHLPRTIRTIAFPDICLCPAVSTIRSSRIWRHGAQLPTSCQARWESCLFLPLGVLAAYDEMLSPYLRPKLQRIPCSYACLLERPACSFVMHDCAQQVCLAACQCKKNSCANHGMCIYARVIFQYRGAQVCASAQRSNIVCSYACSTVVHKGSWKSNNIRTRDLTHSHTCMRMRVPTFMCRCYAKVTRMITVIMTPYIPFIHT
jgi:hypothetical protein